MIESTPFSSLWFSNVSLRSFNEEEERGGADVEDGWQEEEEEGDVIDGDVDDIQLTVEQLYSEVGAEVQARPRGLKAPPVSKFQPDEEKNAFKLKPGFLSLRPLHRGGGGSSSGG